MKKAIAVAVLMFLAAGAYAAEIKLPAPLTDGKVSVEEAIYRRKSVRVYAEDGLTLRDISQVLWSAAGTTVDGRTGATRSYASAGGAYPLEVYIFTGNTAGLKPGIYKYIFQNHSIELLKQGDMRPKLAKAAGGQRMIEDAPMSILFTAIFPKTSLKYGKRGEDRYVYMDMGHAGQNVYLQAQARGLGTVAVGSFNDEAVKKLLGERPENEEPVYIMPVGKTVKPVEEKEENK